MAADRDPLREFNNLVCRAAWRPVHGLRQEDSKVYAELRLADVAIPLALHVAVRHCDASPPCRAMGKTLSRIGLRTVDEKIDYPSFIWSTTAAQVLLAGDGAASLALRTFTSISAVPSTPTHLPLRRSQIFEVGALAPPKTISTTAIPMRHDAPGYTPAKLLFLNAVGDRGLQSAASRLQTTHRYCSARPEWDRGEHHYERSGPRPLEVVFSRSTRAASRIADQIMVCRCWMSSRR
ncbi:MAG: hypothetical protein JWR37_3920 [Mycobacterium sp.]|jgi:hypothetical protein|nr:hypothetical protein [Mycobacterium sp.]